MNSIVNNLFRLSRIPCNAALVPNSNVLLRPLSTIPNAPRQLKERTINPKTSNAQAQRPSNDRMQVQQRQQQQQQQQQPRITKEVPQLDSKKKFNNAAPEVKKRLPVKNADAEDEDDHTDDDDSDSDDNEVEAKGKRSVPPGEKKERQIGPIMNEKIKALKVRLVMEGQGNEVMDTAEALKKAKELKLDLLLVDEKADPPVCKMLDYRKFMEEQKAKEYHRKKERKAKEKASSTSSRLKIIRFGTNIGDHDFERKFNEVKELLEEKSPARVKILLRKVEGMSLEKRQQAAIALLKRIEVGVKDIGKEAIETRAIKGTAEVSSMFVPIKMKKN